MSNYCLLIDKLAFFDAAYIPLSSFKIYLKLGSLRKTSKKFSTDSSNTKTGLIAKPQTTDKNQNHEKGELLDNKDVEEHSEGTTNALPTQRHKNDSKLPDKSKDNKEEKKKAMDVEINYVNHSSSTSPKRRIKSEENKITEGMYIYIYIYNVCIILLGTANL